jgi:antitoxin HicB
VGDAADYAMVLTHAANGDGPVWTATIEELPGCTAHGPTPEEAAAGARSAVQRWLDDAQAAGRDIPPPGAAANHSGKLLVRMPRSLHAELTRASEREGTSLNAYIVAALASAVAWRHDRTGAEPSPPPSGLSRALVANLVVLALIAIIAVALLVSAWQD